MNAKRLRLLATEYGLTPKRMMDVFRETHLPKVLVNSIPKSGTNLLIRTIYLMAPLKRKVMRTIITEEPSDAIKKLKKLRNGEMCVGHLKYYFDLQMGIRELGIRHLFIVRDPRDIAVSNYIYITYKDPRHRLHRYFAESLGSDSERLLASIKGIDAQSLADKKQSLSLGEHYAGYLGWQNDNSCLLVRFEDLIGHQGGGDTAVQHSTLQRMGDFLCLNIGNEEVGEVAREVFCTNSRTFHKGQIGSWKAYFKDIHKDAFKETFGDTLIDLGYESNRDW